MDQHYKTSAYTKKKEKRKKRSPQNKTQSGERARGTATCRVYLLCCMFVTAPTFQVERSPLKAPAEENTVHHRKKKKSKIIIRVGVEEKERRENMDQHYKTSVYTKKKEKRKKRSPQNKTQSGERARGTARVYLLCCMFVTAPTFQAERSPLKAPAEENTVHHRGKKRKSNKEREEKTWIQINITVHTKKGKRKKVQPNKDPILEKEEEKVVYVLDFMVVTAPTFQAEMFAFKELLP
jgi:biopolymer transport protein ExbD